MAVGSETVALNDGRRIGYAVYGATEGRPVMFFSGTPGSRLDARVGGADAVADQRGVRLIVVERPGYGLSDRKPGRRVVDWPDDVRQVADRLGLERFSVYGYSGGGPHALACAARLGDRVTAVAAVSSVGVPGVAGAFEGMGPNERVLHRLTRISPRLVDAVYRLVRRNAQASPDRFFRDFEKDCSDSDRALLADASIREGFRATVLEALSTGVGGAVDDWVALVRYPWGFEPEEVRTPVALVFGAADRIVPVAQGRDLARRIPNAHVREVPGEGHLLIVARLGEILDALEAAASGGTKPEIAPSPPD
jgi:pimeloyl-ACP methyl ester carboxylesterase